MEKEAVLRVIEKAARNKQDRLSISLEGLESLPPEIGKLTNLNTLLLAKNLLESLPPEIGKLTSLNTLLLAKNLLESLPPEIVKLSKLTTLDLSNNKLESLPPEIVKLSKLTTLDLSNNKLESLPPEIGRLNSLTTLNLSNNKLESLPLAIVKLSKLTTLDLSYNKLESLPPEIVKLTNLKTLDLSNNKLESLPPEIVKLMPFTKINLAEEFSFPPPEILMRGGEAQKSYLEGLKAEKQPLNEVKVLLVGDGGAGKTSLVKQLLDEEFDKHESQTHGINLRDWKVEDIHVHFWDFGGQEIMHATHQFFLSKRSLYILVLDGRRDEKTEYWLKHIESFGGNSPILVVLNKIDENPGFEVNRRFLQEKYTGIIGFYRVSCANGQGIKAFTEVLSEVVANVELIETMWPKTWFNVKTQLEAMTENFISIDKYKEMCTKEKITEKTDQDTLVDFLNDLGVILHFKDFELLDTHVLEPKWVTNAVYKIINSEELAECNGLLRLDLLDRILPQKKEKGKPSIFDKILKHEKEIEFYYPREKYRYIIDLMKKFELCYAIDGETVLLPDLLEVPEPEFNFDYDAVLKFVIDYDFLPRSVMPRFIVKMHKDIASELRWRTGVVLEDEAFHSTAVIKADERDEKIYIYVAGEQKRDYFSTIRKTFRDINDSFEKLEAKEMVPLPDNNQITIEYDELIGYELVGRDDFFIGKLRKGYSVKKLLNGIEKEEERRMKTEGGDNINIHIHDLVKDSGKSEVHVEQKTNINIDLKVDLPAIQREFEDLKDLMLESNQDPNLKRKLKEIGASLDEVNAETEKEKLNKPLNKLGRFLKELEDKNLKYHKIVSGTKKGIEVAQKLGKTYNKFAQWLALPQVPDLFLGAVTE